MRIFPKVVDGCDSLKYVFPTKQKDARTAVDIAGRDSRIARLIVFGSAVTDRLGQTSDLDLAVDAPGVCEDDFAKIARGFWKAIPSEVDIVDYNGKKSELLKDEIDNKGVVIYSANKQ